MKYTKFLFVPLLALALASCSKKDDMATPENDPGKLKGDWRVVQLSMKANTRATDEGYVTLATYAYDAAIKSGDLTIDNSNFTFKKLSYDINTVMHMTLVMPGYPNETMDYPWNISIPPSDATNPYRLIGADSIYFEKGFITNSGSDGTEGIESRPSGGHLSWNKDTLVITSNIAINEVAGTVNGTGVVKFVRK